MAPTRAQAWCRYLTSARANRTVLDPKSHGSNGRSHCSRCWQRWRLRDNFVTKKQLLNSDLLAQESDIVPQFGNVALVCTYCRVSSTPRARAGLVHGRTELCGDSMHLGEFALLIEVPLPREPLRTPQRAQKRALFGTNHADLAPVW